MPLDNRRDYTKLDWIFWTASLAENRADFEALTRPVYAFLNATPDRVPTTDWFFTREPKRTGFTARPVVGGVFVRLLENPAVWDRWAGIGAKTTGVWAPLPVVKPRFYVVPTAEKTTSAWRYTTDAPNDNWFAPRFNDTGWKQGEAGFGSAGTPGATIRTPWTSSAIWLRRTITLPDLKTLRGPQLLIHHDEDAEVYINGILAARLGGYTTTYEEVPIAPAARKALRAGDNVIAIHCRQTDGGQYIDVGLVDIRPVK